MLEKTPMEKDLQTATSEAERETIVMKIFNKYHDEFLSFVEELKQSGIAQTLYNSSTPEETISIWEKYSSENQDLFARIKSWAESRDDYFRCYEHFPLFLDEEKLDCILEIGLIIIINKDECFLCYEDINKSFHNELIALLKKSPNRILQAAGCYFDCFDYDSITKENIYNAYHQD